MTVIIKDIPDFNLIKETDCGFSKDSNGKIYFYIWQPDIILGTLQEYKVRYECEIIED